MSPEQLEESAYEDDFDDVEEAEEWQEGQCDNCSGPPRGQDEQRAALASAIVPVCACWIGQGAAPEDCTCGPTEETA